MITKQYMLQDVINYSKRYMYNYMYLYIHVRVCVIQYGVL